MTKLSTSELIAQITKQPIKRELKMLHVHHTWKPDYSNFNGNNHMVLQDNMKAFHVKPVSEGGRGFKDIAQHLTLFPDGSWVTGRSFEVTPASIEGFNTGAFAIEMLGNFDKGQDKMVTNQHSAMIEFCNFMVNRYKLTILFHREHAPKTCPGTGIDKQTFVNEVINFKKA